MSQLLQLDDLLASGKPIYVKNSTKNPGGIIHLSITDPYSGKKQALLIPKTWIPICLNDRLSKSMIEGSWDLRTCISNGALKLVDPEEAKKLLNEEDAQAELQRINKSVHTEKQLSNSVSTNKGIASNLNALNDQHKQSVRESSKDDVTAEAYGPKDDFEENPEYNVHQKVVDTALGVENATIQIRDAVSILRTIEDELTANDYSYVITHVAESQFKNFAKKKLAELRGEAE
jgi:hypothetical protein